MGLSGKTGLGVRLAIVLALLSVLFAGVVYLTILDKASMERTLDAQIRLQNFTQQARLATWYDQVTREYARQMAAPFLWNVETLKGVEQGTPAYQALQRRMWQFVYGRDTAPIWHASPVGPLESVVIVDLDHRIVAASDEMVVDRNFTDPADIARLDAALKTPQIRHIDDQRKDGHPVLELSAPVPNAKGEPIGIVRMRYVGNQLAELPAMPIPHAVVRTQLWGPLLAGLLALLGVGFGALATYEVIQLTRRLEAMAKGKPLPRESRSGVAGRALSMIEERLESLSESVRREDLLVSSLTEALREGVVLLDADGKPIVANRQARQILGLDAMGGVDVGHAFGALRALNPDLEQIVGAGLSARQAVRERTLAVVLPGGREVGVQLTAYVLTEGGTATGMVLVLKDRSSIETLERSLREASRLQAIVRLTGSVAHEVKNPLGAIGIHLEHLRRRLSRLKEADPLAEERVQVIKDEIARLREVLEEWLRLTSPDERVPSSAPLEDTLGSVARLLRVEARHQKVELIVEQEGEPGRVTMPPPRLRQVLLNLCLNALQAMPDGGKLVIRARQVDGDVVLEIEDTGSGIPESVRDQIFDVHFTTRPGGSGLGLAICKRLVEEAGGRIGFETETGRGTTFRIALPTSDSVRDRQQSAELTARS